MTPLDKARVVVEVRKRYESAETREERVRLARELEGLCWQKEVASLIKGSPDRGTLA